MRFPRWPSTRTARFCCSTAARTTSSTARTLQGLRTVFLDDARLAALWEVETPAYLVTYADQLERFEAMLGSTDLHLVTEAGGKVLLANTVARARSQAGPR